MNRRFAIRWINALIIGAAGSLFATGALAQAKGGPAKAAAAPTAAAQTIKIAYIDPLSGPVRRRGLEPAEAVPVHRRLHQCQGLARSARSSSWSSFDNKSSAAGVADGR